MKKEKLFVLILALLAAIVSWGPTAAPAVIDNAEGAPVRETVDLSGAVADPILLDRRPPLAPSLQVRDSNERFVGLVNNLYPEGAEVVGRNGNDLLIFRVEASGVSDSSSVQFVYESGDCSGPALILDKYTVGNAGLAFVLDSKLGTTGYYAVPPFETKTLLSVLYFPVADSECTPTGGIFHPPDQCCLHLDDFSYNAAAVRTVDFSSLVPPFHVEGP
jgi:hypothetical protein